MTTAQRNVHKALQARHKNQGPVRFNKKFETRRPIKLRDSRLTSRQAIQKATKLLCKKLATAPVKKTALNGAVFKNILLYLYMPPNFIIKPKAIAVEAKSIRAKRIDALKECRAAVEKRNAAIERLAALKERRAISQLVVAKVPVNKTLISPHPVSKN
jgi:hypothetical protein